MHTITRNLPLLVACLAMLAACCECEPGTARKHSSTKRPAATAKPEVASPASHNACVNTFKFTPGTEQYTKCISSLSTLETK